MGDVAVNIRKTPKKVQKTTVISVIMAMVTILGGFGFMVVFLQESLSSKVLDQLLLSKDILLIQ